MQCNPLCKPGRQCWWLEGHYKNPVASQIPQIHIYSPAEPRSKSVASSLNREVYNYPLALTTYAVVPSSKKPPLMLRTNTHTPLNFHYSHLGVEHLHRRARASSIIRMRSLRHTTLCKAATTGRKVHVVRVDGLVERLPLLGLPGNNAQNVHGVDLLERALLRLVDEEEGEHHAEEAAAGEDVAVLVADGAGDPGREEGDEEVPQPVGGGAETHGHGAVARREHLSDDRPDEGTPL